MGELQRQNQQDVRIEIQAVTSNVCRSSVIDAYEGQLAKARLGALGVGALQSACRFLAYCNLTWATVVLLGGFVSSIDSLDFRVVSALLLLEAGRLASAIFFSRLLNKALVRLSQNPALLKLEDSQPKLAIKLRVLSQMGQTVFILPSIVLPSMRLRVVNSDVHNLLVSLKIFYILALINSAVGLAAVAVSTWYLIHPFHKTEQSIQRYYDEILQRTFDNGFVQADEFDFFDFAFKMLGKEFARNVQAPTVKKHHEQLLAYMYCHRLGVDFLQIYLDSENAFVQLAAANVVGYWAAEKLIVNDRLPKSLLTKLADKLGPGQVGWAAANSFNALSKLDVGAVLESTGTDKTPVLATLMEMVEPSNKRSLVLVRVLITLVSISKETVGESVRLAQKLETMLREGGIHRLRVLAGYLLLKMEMLNFEACKPLIETIDPTEDDYIYSSELNMLNELRKIIDLQELERDALIHRAIVKGKTKFSVRENL